MSETRTTGAFAEDLHDLTSRGGYRVSQISPADDPSAALLVNNGKFLQLVAEGSDVQLRSADANPIMPVSEAKFEMTKSADHQDFGDGRAGMAYRDLLPSRQGGRIIASHIQIAEAGPVADYVHFHNICFQMIYVHAGWVRLVYEDQGEPFVARAGDCVLQPPHIRHQVLESSAGLEVIEVAAPASHDTFADFDLGLPSATFNSERDFGGQKFWFHQDAEASWRASAYSGFESCELGLMAASGGVAGVQVHRSNSAGFGSPVVSQCENQLFVVLSGELTLTYRSETHQLATLDCVVIPGNEQHQLDAVGPAKILAVDFVGLP